MKLCVQHKPLTLYLINFDKLNCHPILIKVYFKGSAGGVPKVVILFYYKNFYFLYFIVEISNTEKHK